MGRRKKPEGETEAMQRAGGNTQKLQAGFVNELVNLLVEEEPIKEARKAIMAAAKDNGLNTKALTAAAKFKHADSEKRKAYTETIEACDQYLAAVQLSLFPGEEKASPELKKAAEKVNMTVSTKH